MTNPRSTSAAHEQRTRPQLIVRFFLEPFIGPVLCEVAGEGVEGTAGVGWLIGSIRSGGVPIFRVTPRERSARGRGGGWLITGAVAEHREDHIAMMAGQPDNGCAAALAVGSFAIVVDCRDGVVDCLEPHGAKKARSSTVGYLRGRGTHCGSRSQIVA